MGGFSTVGASLSSWCYSCGLGDTLLIANNALKYTYSTTYVKLKEIRIDLLRVSPATLKIYYEFYSTGGNTVYAQIYRNGSAYGTERSTTSTSPIAVTENLQFSQGDYVQIYGKSSTTNDYVNVQNFRIYGSAIPYAPLDPDLSKLFSATNTL